MRHTYIIREAGERPKPGEPEPPAQERAVQAASEDEAIQTRNRELIDTLRTTRRANWQRRYAIKTSTAVSARHDPRCGACHPALVGSADDLYS